MLSMKNAKYYALALGFSLISQVNLNSMSIFSYFKGEEPSFQENPMKNAITQHDYESIYDFYYLTFPKAKLTQKDAIEWLEKNAMTSAPTMYLALRMRYVQNEIEKEAVETLALKYALLSTVREDLALSGQSLQNNIIYNAFLASCNQKTETLEKNISIKAKAIERAAKILEDIDLTNNRNDFFWVLQVNVIEPGYFSNDRKLHFKNRDNGDLAADIAVRIEDTDFEKVSEKRKEIRRIYFKELLKTLPKEEVKAEKTEEATK